MNQSTAYVHSSKSCQLSGIFRMQIAFEICLGWRNVAGRQAGRQLLYNLGLIPRPLPLQNTHKARHGVHVCKPVLGGRDRHPWGSLTSQSHSRPVRDAISKHKCGWHVRKGEVVLCPTTTLLCPHAYTYTHTPLPAYLLIYPKTFAWVKASFGLGLVFYLYFGA